MGVRRGGRAGQRRRFVNLPCSRTLEMGKGQGQELVVDTYYLDLDLDWHSPGHTAQPFWSINPSSLLMLLVPSAVPFLGRANKRKCPKETHTEREGERESAWRCLHFFGICSQGNSIDLTHCSSGTWPGEREGKGRKVCHCN